MKVVAAAAAGFLLGTWFGMLFTPEDNPRPGQIHPNGAPRPLR